MARSKLRDKLRQELASREARRSPSQRLREAEAYRSAALALFQAGLTTCGFNRTKISRLWRQPYPRNVPR